jgi:cobalt-zinc-cadmium resistance protein CzcA
VGPTKQLRAGLLVSSAIPLSMLIALFVMWRFNISANLMSLGAIDFGLIVDGAVIIVENTVRRLAEARRRAGQALDEARRLTITRDEAVEVLKPAVFGMVIIIAAYLPIITLGGTEGRMFRPMALHGHRCAGWGVGTERHGHPRALCVVPEDLSD